MLLDSHQHRHSYGRFDWLCGWGSKRVLTASENSLRRLQKIWQEEESWFLGYLNFNLKNELETLHSQHRDPFALPHLAFFEPAHVLYQDEEGLWLESDHSFEEIEKSLPSEPQATGALPEFEAQISRNEYLKRVEHLMAELRYGNIYEINFCQEFNAIGEIDPVGQYQRLSPRHQAPFGALLRWGDFHSLCFSPERYLRKKGRELISQPIKGTAPRGRDQAADQLEKEQLYQSEKERAENVMIVDLVRNDLSRVARPGSVSVPELFGIYSFEAVHQMISTVRAELEDEFDFSAALAASWPMGSMTGAPKISALELIDHYESFNRGLYSGAIGYLSPEGDFDFNVVIRSLLYDARQKLSSVRVGSAITVYCDPAKEYEECQLKADKLIR